MKTTEGTIYKACTVTKVEPDGITIIYGDGAAKIPFVKLPVDIQQKYNYDPVAAEKHLAALDKAKEFRGHATAVIKSVDDSAIRISGKVVQVVPVSSAKVEGYLIN